MGSLQLCTSVGSIIMHKFLIASCLAFASLASAEADADTYYGSLAATWPASYGYGVQSTCYGCRGHYIGKRSAEADPFYGYGYAAPFYGYGHGIAHHGGHATSFVARSPQGLHGVYGHYIGKRSAEADPMLTTDTDTDSDTDTVWDTDIIWDTMVWDTPMVDTMAMDTVMDMDTATTDKPGACAIFS